MSDHEIFLVISAQGLFVCLLSFFFFFKFSIPGRLV